MPRTQQDLDRRIRKTTRAKLQALRLRPPLSIVELCDRFGRERERPIRLKAHPFEVPGPFGMWVATETEDFIFYQRETTPQHQNHIILHEFGHMLAGHSSDEEDVFAWLLPNLHGAAIRRALRRDSYALQHEREAELVATIVREWTSILDHVAPPSTDDEAVEVVRDALGDRSGWL